MQALEREAAERFEVRHSPEFLTSGLVASVGAIGIAPGDEVIVTLDDGGYCYRDTSLDGFLCLQILIRKHSI